MTFTTIYDSADEIINEIEKLQIYFFSFCMAMEFRKIINGKRMMKVVSKQMGYRNGDEKLILFPLCCKNLKIHILYKSALAAYSYDIKDRKEKLDMKVIILHGEKEI